MSRLEVALSEAVMEVVLPEATVIVPAALTVRAGVPAPDSEGLTVKSPLMVMAPPRV